VGFRVTDPRIGSKHMGQVHGDLAPLLLRRTDLGSNPVRNMALNLLRLTRIALALGLSIGFAHARDVRIAERPQLGNFTTVQAGIDAALEGESLLVTPGVYAPFTIDGKSVQVIGMGSGWVKITGQVLVKNIGPAQRVVMTQLLLTGIAVSPTQRPALEIRDVTGNVRVEASFIEGAPGNQLAGVSGGGVRLVSALNIVFSSCTIEAGYGGYSGGEAPIHGGIGLESINSSSALYDCLIEGGPGSDEGSPQGGNGGAAYSGLSYGLFASGCAFQGGSGGGGDYIGCIPGGVGGDALVMNAGQAHLLANTYVAGAGGWSLCGPISPPGQTIVALNGALIDQLSGSSRKLSAPSITPDDEAVPITISGQPGDTVYLMLARRPSFLFKKPLKGCWMIPTPMFSSALAAGTIGASGTLVVDRKLDIVDGSAAARMVWLQAMCVDGAGQATLTGPEQVLSVDRASAPTWHVDDSALPGGNGSSAAPFQTISEALAKAFYADTILVADGLYQGAGNRALNLNGHSATLRSANGSGACTIDCQGAARVLSMILGERLTLEGFTLVGGAASYAGAIEAKFGVLTMRDVVVSGCMSADGGAVFTSQGELKLESCRFLGNLGTNSTFARGAAIWIDGSRVTGRDCVFASNSAFNGGAVFLGVSMTLRPPVTFTHCSFLDNHATFGGAFALTPDAVFGPIHEFDDCLFAGNTASTDGGALLCRSPVAITNSTFVSNTAGGRGGALYMFRGTANRFDNSIAHGNTAGQGPQFFLGDGGPPAALLSVSYSDVEGGQAAVWLSQGALTWGAGNLDLDPLFTDADGADNNASTFLDNDYSLSASSPCVDAGNNGALSADLLDVDGDGNKSEPVPLDLRHGARRVDVVNTPDTGAGSAPIVDMGALERPF